MGIELDSARINKAAQYLATVRRTGNRLTDLPESCRVRDHWEAYAIQDAVVREMGDEVGGWKASARSTHARTSFAPVFARDIKQSPAVFEGAKLCGVEVEWMFRLERDFPARGQLYDRAEIVEGVSVHPGIEVLESRFLDIRKIRRLSTVADNDCCGGFVFGPAVPEWHGFNLARPRVDVTRNGRLFMMGNGIHGGDPVRNVTELVNHLMFRQGGVRAGALVTTGTCTGITFVEPGDTVVADFGKLGKVEVSFAA